ncbi:hypothetical protein LOC54_03040 [Acetobacter sp. AN02]|uniref:hypothetical protein n=1 Tax=Acetobacter sp. AN02 TaxID=2894186 RepID=UPI0024344467|nr:hypothetical protein [Acetobacter sp. AN02]MDG6094100.1 hypothetical protein [Acetobacter sp. AN02]
MAMEQENDDFELDEDTSGDSRITVAGRYVVSPDVPAGSLAGCAAFEVQDIHRPGARLLGLAPSVFLQPICCEPLSSAICPLQHGGRAGLRMTSFSSPFWR